MKNSKNFRIIITTVDNLELGQLIARKLIENELVACVNIISNITSIYKWEGSIKEDNELILFIKTTKENFDKVEEAILNLHSYSTPEIISIKINKGNKDYLDWMSDSIIKYK